MVKERFRLYDVTLVSEWKKDETGTYPPPRLLSHFRVVAMDDFFQGHCEFDDGHHRTWRGLLTIEEVQELINYYRLVRHKGYSHQGRQAYFPKTGLTHFSDEEQDGMYGFVSLWIMPGCKSHKAAYASWKEGLDGLKAG